MEIDVNPQGYTVHTENILSTASALAARGQTTCKSLICSVSDVAHKFKFMLFHFVYFRTVTLYPTDPAHVCCQHVNMYYICYRQEINTTVPIIQYPRTDPHVPTPSPPVKLCVRMWVCVCVRGSLGDKADRSNTMGFWKERLKVGILGDTNLSRGLNARYSSLSKHPPWFKSSTNKEPLF